MRKEIRSYANFQLIQYNHSQLKLGELSISENYLVIYYILEVRFIFIYSFFISLYIHFLFVKNFGRNFKILHQRVL